MDASVTSFATFAGNKIRHAAAPVSSAMRASRTSSDILDPSDRLVDSAAVGKAVCARARLSGGYKARDSGKSGVDAVHLTAREGRDTNNGRPGRLADAKVKREEG